MGASDTDGLDTVALAPRSSRRMLFVGSSRPRPGFALGFALGTVLALGVAATGCGPKQKFCPDAGDGVCRPIFDAAPKDTYEAPPMEMGAIYIGNDAGTGG